jgi:dTDP-4-dehydrorhamnose reductase
MKLLVLVAGAHGQLGTAMTSQLGVKHEVVGYSRAELDVTEAEDVRKAVASLCPDVIVNCAAYNDVDGAEGAPLAALAGNTWAVRALARAAVEQDAILIHYSTDFVFDGAATRPYTEDDRPNPRSVYAMSKLLGEWFAAEAPRHYVLRVESLFGGERRRSSIDRIAESVRSGVAVRAFSDRTVSPSFVDDVVMATSRLLDVGAPWGVYHCVNTGWTTWSEMAREIARLSGRPDAPITDVRMADAGLAANRPQFAALSNDKLTAAGVAMPTWQNALARYLQHDSQPDHVDRQG